MVGGHPDQSIVAHLNVTHQVCREPRYFSIGREILQGLRPGVDEINALRIILGAVLMVAGVLFITVR